MVAPEWRPAVAGGLLLGIVSDAIVVPVMAGLSVLPSVKMWRRAGSRLTSAVVEVTVGG